MKSRVIKCDRAAAVLAGVTPGGVIYNTTGIDDAIANAQAEADAAPESDYWRGRLEGLQIGRSWLVVSASVVPVPAEDLLAALNAAALPQSDPSKARQQRTLKRRRRKK